MSAEAGSISTVEHAGFTVTSSDSKADATAALSGAAEAGVEITEGEDGDPIKKAASVLGKSGGKAAAKARTEAAKEKPPAQEAKPAEQSDEDHDEAEPTEEKPLGKPRDDPRARIHELNEKRKAAEEKARLAEERAARLEREQAEARRVPPPPQPPVREEAKAPEGKPRPEDFESYEDYLDERDKYNRKTWEAEIEQRNQQETRVQKIRSMAQSIKESTEAYRKVDPDYDTRVTPEITGLYPSFEAIRRNERPDARHFIADEIVQDPENAPRLMVYLSEQKAEFQRIAALSNPRAVTRAIGMIVARLDAATTATSSEPEGSKAPPPVRPVTGAPVAAAFQYREGMSFDEYLDAKKVKARR